MGIVRDIDPGYHTGVNKPTAERITVSLSSALASDLRRVSRTTRRPVSHLVAAAIARELASVLVVPEAS